jgi:prepilin-type N-terminal cleavage/methylation domain-containing protein
VTSYNKGFTLIELLIAMFIITLSMLAILTTMTMAMKTNMETDVRNTAVRLTNQTAEVLHALQWSEVDIAGGSVLQTDPELTATSPGSPHRRDAGNTNQDAKGFPVLSQTVRNFRQDYQIAWDVEDVTDKSKRITITVAYTGNGQVFSNVSVIFRNRKK